MENELNTTLKNIRNIRMTDAEKSVVLNNLVVFMEEHPVKAELQAEIKRASFLKPEPSPFFSRFSFAPAFKLVAVVLVIAIVAGGGVSYAAAGALPGDLLYPAKVNFSEAIANVTKLTPEAKAAYAESRVEARLQEAETLIKKGKFEGTRQAVAEAAIDTHMEIVRARIQKLPADKREKFARTADEVLAAKVARHRAMVAALAKNQPAESAIPSVRDTETETPGTSQNTGTVPVSTAAPVEGGTSPTASATGGLVPSGTELAAIAEREIFAATMAVNELRAIRITHDAVRTKLERRIIEIDIVIKSAKQEFRDGNYRDAIALARKAVQGARATKDAIAKLVAEMNADNGDSPAPSPEPTGSTATQ